MSLSNDGNTVSIGSSVVPPITARYLFYQLETENEYLMISEVEIYDETGNNIALNKPSIESTTYGSDLPLHMLMMVLSMILIIIFLVVGL